MMKPQFRHVQNGNGNWDVVMSRETHTGVKIEEHPVLAELPEEDDAITAAMDLNAAALTFARTLLNVSDHRTEDDIVLTFSF